MGQMLPASDWSNWTDGESVTRRYPVLELGPLPPNGIYLQGDQRLSTSAFNNDQKPLIVPGLESAPFMYQEAPFASLVVTNKSSRLEIMCRHQTSACGRASNAPLLLQCLVIDFSSGKFVQPLLRGAYLFN